MIHWILRILRRSNLRGSKESQFLNHKRWYSDRFYTGSPL